MYLQQSKNKKTGRTHLAIVHKYRDKDTKKIRSKTIKTLGYLDVLEKDYDDPVAYFTAMAKEMDDARKRENASYTITIGKQECLDIGTDNVKNFGYAALSRIYHELGIHTFLKNRQRHTRHGFDANVITQMLVYSRLLYPSSKKSAYENRGRFFEKTDYSRDDVYRCLTFLSKQRESLQVWLDRKVSEKYGRDASILYYDVTNYYFETDDPNGFLMKGVSKEHRPNPIVQMGLFIDSNGLPLTYELFPGNTNDCLTYRPNLQRVKRDFDYGRVITVADKAMTTGDNIWYTKTAPSKDGYVFSMSVRGADKELKNYVLDESGYEWLGTEYKRKSRRYPRTILVTSVTGKKIKKTADEKQVVFWSEKYARRAKAERAAALLKAEDMTRNPGSYNKSTSYGAAKYIKKINFDEETGEILAASSTLEIDYDKLREEEALDGYYVIVTSEMEESDDRVIDMYRGLWKIEESFKVTKSHLESRPVYVWTREHIEAHFLTCFIALLIIRILEMKLGNAYSTERILASLKKSNCIFAGENLYLFSFYNEVLEAVGKATGTKYNQRILSLGEIKKILGATKITDL